LNDSIDLLLLSEVFIVGLLTLLIGIIDLLLDRTLVLLKVLKLPLII